MNFISVCSGILGAELAWEPLGWHPQWCAEIDPFASRLIAYRRKELLNLGDFTQATPPPGTVNVAVGGTPCQTFSDAGERAGLDDPRGQLSLEFARLARRVGARWLVWENVPGVFSSGNGVDLRTVLRVFAECGYHGCWRTLDASFFGLAQRRLRVFFVGYLGDWRPPAAVLFERPSLSGNPRQSRPKGTPFAKGVGSRPASCLGTNPTGGLDSQNVIAFEPAQITSAENRSNPQPGNLAPALCATGRPAVSVSRTLLAKGNCSWDQHTETLVSHTIGASRSLIDGAGAFVAFEANQIASPGCVSNPQPGNASPTLGKNTRMAVARTVRARHDSGGDPTQDTWISQGTGIRKLTPLEYERLQGFPDLWTLIPGASDSARYRAIGNAFPVPVLRWIGQRIEMVERITGGRP